jgi:hypothetical protein
MSLADLFKPRVMTENLIWEVLTPKLSEMLES